MFKLEHSQKIPLSLKESWEFFSTPANLKLLSPPHLNFEMADATDKRKMYAGQLITHRIRPLLNLSLDWVSEITQIQEPEYFIDEQRFGPYKFWHHEHRFTPIPDGVEITDIIHYKMPFGFLGKILHSLKVKHDLEAIFTYRRAKLEELFGPYQEL